MQWLKYRSLFLPPLTVQGECLWSTGGYSLHPVVLLFLEALSSSSLTREKERKSLKGVCPVIICMFPAFIPLDCTSHIATSNCERDWEMYSSYVQRKERLTFGKELSVSATICFYSPQISVQTLLPAHRPYLLPKRTNLKFHPFIAPVSKFRILGRCAVFQLALWTKWKLFVPDSHPLVMWLKWITAHAIPCQNIL